MLTEQTLHFAFFPSGGENTASSRIRVYTLIRELEKRGIPASLGFSSRANVFFVQKKVNQTILQRVRLAKLGDNIVLYDVSDLGDALWSVVSRSDFRKMVGLADIVTCATVSQAEQLASRYGVSCPKVVADSIDYFPSGIVRSSLSQSNPLRVLWFGHSMNMGLTEPYINVLLTIPNLEVVIVTQAAFIELFSHRYPGVHFVPWSISSFVSVLQSCHLAFLPHDGSVQDRAKSNNRMITSIAWGVPALVSRTPEYERTAREAGIESALFADQNDLKVAIERLRSPQARTDYLDIAQPVIWKHYSPDKIAQDYLRLITQTACSYSITTRLTKVLWSFVDRPSFRSSLPEAIRRS